MDNIGFNDEILVEKRGGLGRVRMYSAHLGRGEEHDVDVLPGEEFRHGTLIQQVQLLS
jgi:hypothetical protein